MSGVNFFNKLPRTRLYFKPVETFIKSVRHLPKLKTRGKISRKFEAEFSRHSQTRHAVSFPHARVALHYILKHLNLPAGSEVILTPVTVPDLINVFLSFNLRPVFVDFEHHSCNINYSLIEQNINPKTRLLFITHLSGIPSEMKQIEKLAEKYKLKIIEDASQALGAGIYGQALGSFGFASIFSISTLKTVATYHGGMACTNDDRLASYLKDCATALPLPSPLQFLEYFIRDNAFFLATQRKLFSLLTYYAVLIGESLTPKLLKDVQSGNILARDTTLYALQKRTALPEQLFIQYTEYQADLGLLALEHLQEENNKRRELSLLLYELLEQKNINGLPKLPQGESSTFWRFPLFVENPSHFKTFLRNKYIDCSNTNLICMSREKMFVEIARACPNAETFTDRAVFLPVHSSFSKTDMRSIATVVAEYFRQDGV